MTFLYFLTWIEVAGDLSVSIFYVMESSVWPEKNPVNKNCNKKINF